MIGKQFERWTIVDHVNSGRHARWLARCECGTVRKVLQSNLLDGRSRSCGCLHRDVMRAIKTKHGLSTHPLYAVWEGMLARCDRPSDIAYANYGGRGITVCKHWYSFENFYADMHVGYKKGLTLDRVDNSKGYSPQNCAWKSHTEQMNNTRVNRYIDTPMGRMILCRAAKLSGIGPMTLTGRIKRGWPTERLFERPPIMPIGALAQALKR